MKSQLSPLSSIDIDWQNTSDIDIAKRFNLKRHTVYGYRKRHNIPGGPLIRTSKIYSNCGRNKVTDIDHEYSMSLHKGRRRPTANWRKAVKDYFGEACMICSYHKPPVSNHCHHRVEIFNSGKNTIRNSIVLCSRCHEEAHAGLITLPEFKER